MSREARRFLRLVRDERRIAQGLALHEARRFDAEATAELRDYVVFALETIRDIAADGDIWQRLEDAARGPLNEEQAQRLSSVAFTALPPLLEAAGYRSPPPPPATDLVDDTVAALAAALEDRHDEQSAAGRVREARWQLDTFSIRARRQIDVSRDAGRTEPSMLRSIARTTGRAARWLIPKVAGVTAGLLVESQMPGTGLGVPLGKAAEKLTEDGVEIAATTIVGRLPFDAPTAVPDPEPVREPGDPLPIHVAAISLELSQARQLLDAATRVDEERMAELSSECRRRILAAERHLERIEDLVADRGQLDLPMVNSLNEVASRLRRAYRGTAEELIANVDLLDLLELLMSNIDEAEQATEELQWRLRDAFPWPDTVGG